MPKCFGRIDEEKEVAGNKVTVSHCTVVGDNWQRVCLKNCGINCAFYKPVGEENNGRMTMREFKPYRDELKEIVHAMPERRTE